MSDVAKAKVNKDGIPEGQHIFHADRLEPLAKRWQELNKNGETEEAMKLLEQIVILSTPMFERFAMHEEYHKKVQLPLLVAAAQQRVVVWLLKWDPEKGRLFSWFGKCAKNAFRGVIADERRFSDRIHTTDENLEKFVGSCDHEVDRIDSAAEVRERIQRISSRWGHPQEIGTLHYLLECIIDTNHSKESAIQGASFAWGLSVDTVRFFYGWCIMSLRHVMMDKISIRLTEQDLFNCKFSYTFLPDFLKIIPWNKVNHTCPECGHSFSCSSGSFKDLCATFGGQRIKFPSIDELIKLSEDYNISLEILDSDMDPESVTDVVKRHNRPARTAEQIFKEMSQMHDQSLLGEHDIYNEP